MGKANPNARGERIRAARKAAGLTLAALARRCEFHLSYLSAVERGDADPGREFLFRIANALGTSAEYLETGVESYQDADRRGFFAARWEVLYAAANHTALVASLQGRALDVPDPAVRVAVDRARDAAHLCEYLGWGASDEALALLNVDRHAQPIMALAAQVADRPLPAGIWQQLPIQAEDAADAVSKHASSNPRVCSVMSHLGVAHEPDDPECYARDMFGIYRLMALLTGRDPIYLTRTAVDPPFVRTSLKRRFVADAFPELFWIIGRTWSRRRLGLWCQRAGFDAAVYRPLTTIAAESESLGAFVGGAELLLDRVPMEAAETLLAMLPMMYLNRADLFECYAVEPLAREPYQVGLSPVAEWFEQHARVRRQDGLQFAFNQLLKVNNPKLDEAIESAIHALQRGFGGLWAMPVMWRDGPDKYILRRQADVDSQTADPASTGSASPPPAAAAPPVRKARPRAAARRRRKAGR